MSSAAGVKRTRNVLASLAAARPVVSTAWVDKCAAAGKDVDATPFLVRDKKAEKQFGFNMAESLGACVQLPCRSAVRCLTRRRLVTAAAASRRKKLLEDHVLYVLPGSDAVCDMLAAVAPLAGARVASTLSEDVTLVLGTAGAADAARRRALAAGKTVREPEFLLTALMQQRLPR